MAVVVLTYLLTVAIDLLSLFYSPLQPGAEFGADGKMKGTAGATADSARAITGTDGRSYFGTLPG
mgnify:CR=1 FL=1